ncbi:hypothetical protein AB0C68_40545 [Streptomyces tendae]|uniref:hypothetical protein n=1 Tax=Streptomyces tendae TaxID=1932 RepID=UPI0033C42850
MTSPITSRPSASEIGLEDSREGRIRPQPLVERIGEEPDLDESNLSLNPDHHMGVAPDRGRLATQLQRWQPVRRTQRNSRMIHLKLNAGDLHACPSLVPVI